MKYFYKTRTNDDYKNEKTNEKDMEIQYKITNNNYCQMTILHLVSSAQKQEKIMKEKNEYENFKGFEFTEKYEKYIVEVLKPRLPILK